MSKISAVITAAGMSRRMGKYKPLLPYKDATIAECCVRNLMTAGVEEITVVTGYNARLLQNALAHLPVKFLYNPDYETTNMLESLCIGLSALSTDCERVLITPIDIPEILPETVRRLIALQGDFICPVYHGTLGHPVVLNAGYIQEITAYRGEDGLRGAIQALGILPEYMPTEDAGTTMDADTPEDYERILALGALRENNKT